MISLLLLAYYLLIILGGSFACAKLFYLVFRKFNISSNYSLPIGVLLLAVLSAYAGFTGLARIPYFAEVVCVVFAIYGALRVYKFLPKLNPKRLPKGWYLYSVPFIFMAILVYNKKAMLTGGITHGDEGRSLTFTSVIANNYLKPGFSFDPSFPLAYPYYPFEIAGLLYRGVQGFMFPSIAILAVTIVLLSLSFYLLFIISKKISAELGGRIFFFTSLILIFPGIRYIRDNLDEVIGHRVGAEILPMYLYFHSHYHFLFGTIAAALGIYHLWKFIKERKSCDWILFIVLFAISAGFSGLPFGWAFLSAVLILILFLISGKIRAFKLLLKSTPIALALIIVLLAPQFFSFMPRMTVLGFSMPHFWFPWSLEKLGWEQAGLIGDLKSLFFPLDIAISVLGPIIGIGVFLIPIAGIIKFIKTREWNETPVHFLTICTIAAILILTFTDSSYEWHAHGFLFMTVCVSIIAGWFIAKLSCGKYRHVVIGIFTLMLIIQVPYFVINYIQRQSDPAPPDAIAMQENVPFGTVVYKYRDPREVYMEDSEFYNNLRRGMGYAGRLVIFPTMAHLPYMNHPRVLNKLADPIFFRPCNKTRYGMNIPDGNYLEIIDGKMVERSCRDPKVAKRTYMRVAPR